ncbi:MAG: Hsp33 family molecular chaperone HslO [Proteobacteria bacterium]|nr:Hsp33 family molecular chaperone HslO [Pseudomonadota bacterium]
MSEISPAPPRDEIVRALSEDGGVAVRAIVATSLVAEAARRHGLSPTATQALGRALMGAVLLAVSGKHGASVQLQFRGDGPLGVVTVIANEDGEVRGFVGRPDARVSARPDGEADVASAVGRGVLAVVRNHPSWREPHRGIVPLVSGAVARDLAHYLSESEQTPSAISLGAVTGEAGEVVAASGFLVQALPGADDAVLAQVEENVRALPSTARLVAGGCDAGGLVERLLAGVGSRGHASQATRFHCGCEPDRVQRSVALLGRDELLEAARGGEPLEVVCQFCAERYSVAPSELAALAEEAS